MASLFQHLASEHTEQWLAPDQCLEFLAAHHAKCQDKVDDEEQQQRKQTADQVDVGVGRDS